MSLKIVLAGNPNSGKTTLFNELTGSNQHVGNWPGVTVEKKVGKLKSQKDVDIIDLPGIYSLSPYTLEEVISRDYIINEKPDAIINIVDASNIERNLYLSTQLLELGFPVVIALNMIDVVRKNGDKINLDGLSKQLGVPVLEISAMKKIGIAEITAKAIEVANAKKSPDFKVDFPDEVEAALTNIENLVADEIHNIDKRWAAIKLFERDKKVLESITLSEAVTDAIEQEITVAEDSLDDDAESLVTTARYDFITEIVSRDIKRKNKGKLTVSDKIDKVVTNRILALPIFAVVMFLVYYLAISTVGTMGTDWVNDGVFGDGYHLFGIGGSEYEEAVGEYDKALAIIEANDAGETTLNIENDNGEIEETITITDEIIGEADELINQNEPDPADYGVWVPGVPVVVGGWLEAANASDWLQSLILDGIVGGVGAVIGFLPQMLVLFILLAILEECGYMSRIAFIMDRLFRKFGLSGKSFIPILVGTGCGVPGVLASRTIENDRDRKMTVIVTTFIPCGAKLPIIALLAGAIFNNAWWVAPSAYFVGIAAILISGIMLKKMKLFYGDPAPFVLELPAYHAPRVYSVFKQMWDKGVAFVVRAGTVIFVSCGIIWFLQSFNWSFEMVDTNDSILASIGSFVAPLFAPLGWNNWKAAVGTVTGLVAKENFVATFGVLFGVAEVAEDGVEIWSQFSETFSAVAAYSLLMFNLLCAPCFAAIGAIKREMGNWKWTCIAVGYQTGFAYVTSFIFYQLGSFFTGHGFNILTAIAILAFAGLVYLVVRKPYRPKATSKN